MEEYLKARYRVQLDQKPPIKIRGFKRSLHLIRLFRNLGFKKGAEIGVASGRNMFYICNRVPGVQMIGVDIWTQYEYDRAGRWCHHVYDHKKNYEWAKQKLAQFNVNLIKGTSMDVVKTIEENSLDFIYIDANHYYDYVRDDLNEWSKRVRLGGIVSGHDYADSPNCDVIKAVNEYVEQNKIGQWFLTDEWPNSYFWMKQ